MKTIIKLLNWIAWISGGIGLFIILIGVIALILNRRIIPAIGPTIDYYHIASCFFLLTIALFICIGQYKKE